MVVLCCAVLWLSQVRQGSSGHGCSAQVVVGSRVCLMFPRSRVRMLRSLGKGKGGEEHHHHRFRLLLAVLRLLAVSNPLVRLVSPSLSPGVRTARTTDRQRDRPTIQRHLRPARLLCCRQKVRVCEVKGEILHAAIGKWQQRRPLDLLPSPWSSHFTAASTGRTGVGRVQAQHGHASAPPDMHASFPLHREWGHARLVKLWLFEKVDAGVVPACEPVGLPPTSLLSFPLHNSLAHPSSHDMQRPPSLSPKSQALQQQYSWAGMQWNRRPFF
ncbi:hypothetical protein K456DRAFT_244254 [Colletotrichum gloeosporioides 23]|nr:hypothetical protein K456DRAFT_244254 [Colletotrichum gloeosporioides 23]